MNVISIAAQPGTRAVEHIPGGFVFECMCGEITGVQLTIGGDREGRAEFAATCDACLEAHWFLVTRRAA